MIISIDGPAAAGKGTLAKRIAARLDLAYLDSGALYRAVGLAVLNAGGDPADPDTATAAAEALDHGTLGAPALRTDRVAAAASQVAAIPSVRAALLDFQRRFAATPPDGKAGAVLDGRDIGTVVCPDADVKLFVTASVEERARRRVKELLERGEEAIYGAVLQEMQDRDARDRDREVAPLTPAEDAIVIDTTDLDADAALEAALRFISDIR
ncbi:MAG: (d)CMP kinase [Bauldia litoralis]